MSTTGLSPYTVKKINKRVTSIPATETVNSITETTPMKQKAQLQAESTAPKYPKPHSPNMIDSQKYKPNTPIQ